MTFTSYNKASLGYNGYIVPYLQLQKPTSNVYSTHTQCTLNELCQNCDKKQCMAQSFIQQGLKIQDLSLSLAWQDVVRIRQLF